MNTTNTKPPVAWVLNAEPNTTYAGAHILTVACPYCGGRHQHGTRSLNEYGHRVAHCPYDPDGRGYTLRDPDPRHITREDLLILTSGCNVLTRAGWVCGKPLGGRLGHACPRHAWMPPAPGTHYQKAQTR